MKTLLRSVLVVDPGSPIHGKRKDILIHDGFIKEIADSLAEVKAREIIGNDLHVSPGWTDLRANFCDPGYEFREDITTGLRAARKGGFTSVLLMPSTLPVIDSKGAVEYLLSRSGAEGVRILPSGTISDKLQGKQLSEMFDMHEAGAVAFTDDKLDVNTELMTRALEYTRNFGGLVMSFPFDDGVCGDGQMNEGPVSVSLGMKGIPNVSEEIRVQRDIDLLRYSGGRLHFSLISAARSVELIRRAKREGLAVTCAVAAHQLLFTDEDLRTFDSNYKVLPPFRSKEDRKALIAGLKDGTIDAICSDHFPDDTEHKIREFEDAGFGISAVEAAFCMAWTALEKSLNVDDFITLLTTGPANVLKSEVSRIAVGAPADITVFSLAENTKFDSGNWVSRSRNSPVIGKELRGKVYPL